MKRFSYRLFRWASALNYHLPRRFTKGGLLLLVGMVLTGAVGTDIEQSVAFEAFALLFCLLGVAVLSAPWFRGRFVVRRLLPTMASVGQPFRYRVLVSNSQARSYRDLEILEDLAEPHPTYEEFIEALVPPGRPKTFRLSPPQGPGLDLRPATFTAGRLPRLTPGATAEAELEVLPLRRGPLRLGGVTLARPDPLGLVRGFIRITLPQTVLVLPKRYRLPSFSLPGALHYQPGGVALASSVGESEEFVSLREYRPGDPFRRVHWRSWARVGRPIVKEHQDEFFARHGLVLDTFAALTQAEVFEEAVSVAASFACALDTQESLLDLLFVGVQAYCLTAGRGLGRPEQVLEILASVRSNRDGRFQDLSDLVLRHASVLSGCICVLVGWDEARRELVRKLGALGLPLLTLIVADEETRVAVEQDPARPDRLLVLRPGQVAEALRSLEQVLA